MPAQPMPPALTEPVLPPGQALKPKPPQAVAPSAETAPARPEQAQSPQRPTLDDLFGQLKLAKTAEEAKQIEQLIDVLQMDSGSDTIDLLMTRALAAVQNQDMALAFDLLDTVIALKPDFVEGWNKRATLYFLKHDFGKAISDVEVVLRLQPRHPNALIGLATMLKELGDPKHALLVLRRAQDISPQNEDVQKAIEDLRVTVDGREL